jgi:hypothetical protein
MKRPVGVVLTAIVQVLGSLFVLLLSIVTLLVPLSMRRTPAPPSPTPIPSWMFVALAAFYGVLAVAGFLTAIGLFRLKRWSRYSTILFAAILVFLGLTLALTFAVMPFPQVGSGNAAVNAASFAKVKIVMAAISLATAALGGLWLYYFNRRNIKAAFTHADEGGLDSASGLLIGGRRVPLSIAVIAGFNLFGAVATLAVALWFPNALVFGYFISGKSAVAYMILFGLVQVFIGVGCLKLWKSGRTAGILFNCYGLMNAAILLLMSSRHLAEIELQIQQASPTHWPTMPTTADALLPVLRLGTVAGAVATLIMLYYLVTRRGAFQPNRTA